MKRQQFNNVLNRMKETDGKEHFESVVQYAGYWFLNLTEKQSYELADFLHKKFRYPTIKNDSGMWVICPNGMQLLIKEN